MKKSVLLIVMMVSVSAYAGNTVTYTYDSAGNRVSRIVVPQNGSSNADGGNSGTEVKNDEHEQEGSTETGSKNEEKD